ncbi:MAG: tyrosine-type recombinase/integrase [Acidobacteriota bacterium]|nr:tyrosine-type recombinase/integrase [Acidobacteriota bacterium]
MRCAFRSQACLKTIYACGLRLLEGTRLQVPDVDSARRQLHIHGKGKQDRYVSLPLATLKLLRAHWSTHRSPLWSFPAPTRHELAHSLAPQSQPTTAPRDGHGCGVHPPLPASTPCRAVAPR